MSHGTVNVADGPREGEDYEVVGVRRLNGERVVIGWTARSDGGSLLIAAGLDPKYRAAFVRRRPSNGADA